MNLVHNSWLAAEALAPAHIDTFLHGWRVTTQLEERKLPLEALVDPDLFTSCQRCQIIKSVEADTSGDLLRLTMSIASAALTRLDHITGDGVKGSGVEVRELDSYDRLPSWSLLARDRVRHGQGRHHQNEGLHR